MDATIDEIHSIDGEITYMRREQYPYPVSVRPVKYRVSKSLQIGVGNDLQSAVWSEVDHIQSAHRIRELVTNAGRKLKWDRTAGLNNVHCDMVEDVYNVDDYTLYLTPKANIEYVNDIDNFFRIKELPFVNERFITQDLPPHVSAILYGNHAIREEYRPAGEWVESEYYTFEFYYSCAVVNPNAVVIFDDTTRRKVGNIIWNQ